MKRSILFYLYFAVILLVAITTVNSNSESVIITNMQTMQETTANQKLEPFIADGQNKIIKSVNDNFSTPINMDNERFRKKVRLYDEKPFSTESYPGYQMMQLENELDERPRHLNLSAIQRNSNYLQQLMNDFRGKREFFLDPYYPTLYHRLQFNEYGRNLYHPYDPRIYGIRNFNKRFMDRKRHPKILLENQDITTEKEIISPPEKIILPFISLPASSNFHQKFPTFAPITAKSMNDTAEHSVNKPNENKLNIKIKLFNRTTQNVINISKIASNLNKDVKRIKSSVNNQIQKQGETKSNNTDVNENKSFYPHSNYFNLVKRNENEKSDNRMIPIGSGNARDDFKKGSSNKLLYNRVYFEKVPLNFNLSWFVYVNCSRERCLLSNSTNELDLLNEGWILHNCTHYGCTEMYPQIESMQKFIGLILLVFSICVLKIILFLLLFYYCRRLKMSKIASVDQDPDEEMADSINDEKKSPQKNYDNGRNRAVSIEKFESTFSNQKNNSTQTFFKELYSPGTQEIEKDQSKMWTPTDQNVTPCLIASAPNENILIPQKAFEKKVHAIKISALPKCKKKGRSNIPRLEKWAKDKAKIGAKKTQSNPDRKPPTRCEPTPGGDGDILLMNLDDEIIVTNSCTPGQMDKTPKWSTVLENECKSFISLELSDK